VEVLPEKLPVAFLEVRALSHATEDEEKVYQALKNVVTGSLLEESPASRRKLEGHYGNPITLLTLKVRSKPQIKRILANIFSGLSARDRGKLLAELENRIDGEGNLYLRFDKQEACLGRLKLGASDPIRVRIKLSIPARQRSRLVEACREMVEEFKGGKD